MGFALTFTANGGRNPVTLPYLRDGQTEAAYVVTGKTFVILYGTRRPDGTITPLGEFVATDEVVTVNGTTWNFVQFDPDPDDLTDIPGGDYAADLILRDDADETDFDNLDTGTITIKRGASE